MAVNIDRELEQPRRILDAYVALLGERFKHRPARPLYELVGDQGDSRFVSILKDLSAMLTDPPQAPEKDFFSRSLSSSQKKSRSWRTAPRRRSPPAISNNSPGPATALADNPIHAPPRTTSAEPTTLRHRAAATRRRPLR